MEHYWLLGGAAGTVALLALGWWLRGYEIKIYEKRIEELTEQLDLANRATEAAAGLIASDRAALDASSEPDPVARGLLLLGEGGPGSGEAPGADSGASGAAEPVEA